MTVTEYAQHVDDARTLTESLTDRDDFALAV